MVFPSAMTNSTAAAGNSSLGLAFPVHFKMTPCMKKFFGTSLVVGLTVIGAMAQTAVNFGSLPLCFESLNNGTQFSAHTADGAFRVSADGASFALRQADGTAAACTMQFAGANAHAPLTGEAQLAGKINRLIGNDASQWQKNISTYGQVRMAEIYPGISVVYYGNGRQLEYDFNLAAGIDPQIIKIGFVGAKNVSVNSQGELVLALSEGTVTQHRPVVYQTDGATRHEIKGGYKLLTNGLVAFEIAQFDSRLPLTIDPILSFSSFFGGKYGENAHAIALDKSGNIYIAGETLSAVFSNTIPTGYQTHFAGGNITGDAFVAKINPNGNTVDYFTYLGGSADDAIYGIAVDNSGNVFLTGATDSDNFPTNNPIYGKIAGSIVPVTGHHYADAFVTELNAEGTGLVYSTYLGGNQPDIGVSICVDTNTGKAYIAGYTCSTNLPFTTSAWQTNLNCPNSIFFNANAFVAEIASGGTSNLYCSYLGGTNYDSATGITLGPDGSIYVCGYTASTNFPCINALVFSVTNVTTVGTNSVTNIVTRYFNHLNQSTNLTTTASYDAFVTKFKPDFAGVDYSTFLGGANNDYANGIAVDGAGNAYVVGGTISTNFPVLNPLAALTSYVQTNRSGILAATNAFLTKINAFQYSPTTTNCTLGFSLMFGGSVNQYNNYAIDIANGVALDPAGNIYVIGSATSTNFPVTKQNIYGSLRATNSGGSDVFVTVLTSNATSVIYSTYIGGNADDFGNAITVDTAGNAYLAGVTLSTNFPNFNAWQTNRIGTNDAFFAKIYAPGGEPKLSIKPAGAYVLLSWAPTNDVSVTNLNLLESVTNLLSSKPYYVTNGHIITTNISWFPATNWIILTNFPAIYNTGTNYINTIPPSNYMYMLPYTNSAQFFRFHR
jgi:hypothetical protein